MGAGASATDLALLPDHLSAAQAKEYCGLHYDDNTFNEYKRNDGLVDKSVLIAKVQAFENEGLRQKFSAIVPFERDLWDPLLKTFYYREIMSRALPEYTAADKNGRRRLLLLSYSNLPDSAKCCECCGVSFASGKLCRRERTKVHCGPGKSINVWERFEEADPDEIAIHLWTYSMGGSESFYRRVNKALLNENSTLLQQLCYIICGVVTWINSHVSNNTSDLTLYRGTPISKSQEHNTGDALHPRFALADFIDPEDTPAIEAAKATAKKTHDRAKNICRMPMFLAASESLAKAQEFTWIRENGISCPILEFILPPNCDGVAHVEPLSHFPEEKEYLLSAYSPVEYKSQRLEYLHIGCNADAKVKLVMIVTYRILGAKATFEEFEITGQDLKSAVIMCMPARTAFLERHERLHDRHYGFSAFKNSKQSYLDSERMVQNRLDDMSECAMISRHMGPFGTDELAQKLQLADGTNDENQMKKAIDAFTALYPQCDAISILNSFHAFRKTADFLAKKQKLSSAEETLQEFIKQKEAAEKEASRCAIRLNELHEKQTHLEEKIRALQTKVDNAQDELNSLKRELDALRTELSHLEDEIKSVTNKLTLALAELSTWRRQLSALQAEERRAYTRFWERKAASFVSEEDRQQLEADLKTAGDEYIESVFPKEEMIRLEKNVHALETSLQDNKTKLDVCGDAIAEKEKEVKSQEIILKDLEESLRKLENSLNEVLSEIDTVQFQQMNANQQVDELTSSCTRQEKAIAKANDDILYTIRDDFVVPYIPKL